jgi:hypothetical protein
MELIRVDCTANLTQQKTLQVQICKRKTEHDISATRNQNATLGDSREMLTGYDLEAVEAVAVGPGGDLVGAPLLVGATGLYAMEYVDGASAHRACRRLAAVGQSSLAAPPRPPVPRLEQRFLRLPPPRGEMRWSVVAAGSEPTEEDKADRAVVSERHGWADTLVFPGPVRFDRMTRTKRNTAHILWV